MWLTALQVNQILVLDYLIVDEDRHQNNFGLIRNANTLEWIGLELRIRFSTEVLPWDTISYRDRFCPSAIWSVSPLRELTQSN